MSRRLGVALVALVLGGLALSSCGSVSESTAMANWVRESSYVKNNATLVRDVEHSASAVREASSTSNALHTVCGVLYTDTEAANASLPTPDRQATALLNRAYEDLGDGAQQCYQSAGSASERAKSLASLARGLAALSEAAARVATASTP